MGWLTRFPPCPGLDLDTPTLNPAKDASGPPPGTKDELTPGGGMPPRKADRGAGDVRQKPGQDGYAKPGIRREE